MHRLPTPRVLVVDDEPQVRNGLAVWLDARAFSVVTAADLRSAAAAAIEHLPDAVLLDVKLGAENGLDLIALMREAGLAIPCVILTAHAGPYDGFKARELGAAALIEKPSSPDEIANALRRVVTTRPASTSTGAMRSDYVGRAVQLIHDNFRTKGVSLEALARSAGVSAGHLSRVFRRETGCSVLSHIHGRRVELAAYLLKTTTLSVKVIADDCGYHSSSELHRHFSRRIGQSPLGFRVSERQASREPR